MKTVATTLAFAASAYAQAAASVAVADSTAVVPPAVPVAGAVPPAAPNTGFLTGYLSTVQNAFGNAGRPAGAAPLPLVPAVNSLLSGTGSVIEGVTDPITGFALGLSGLFQTAGQGAQALSQGVSVTPTLVVGSAAGAPVSVPLLLPGWSLAHPFTGLYDILTGANSAANLITPLPGALNAPYPTTAIPAPITGAVVATTDIGNGVLGSFVDVLSGITNAGRNLLKAPVPASAYNAALAAGSAAAAKDMSYGTIVGLTQALNTLPAGSVVVPVVASTNTTVTARRFRA